MVQLVIPAGALIRLVWSRSGAPYAVNVLGAQNTGSAVFGQALANTIGAAIKGAFTSSGFGARVSSDFALATIGVRNINTANQAEFTDSGAAVAGTNASDPLPAQTCLVVTLRTANAGPSYRGRVYLPGFAEDTNDTNGACLAAASADALTFISAIQTIIDANGLTSAVLSRPRDARTIPARTITAKAGFLTPVTAAVVRDLVWDTQRRRQTAGV